MNEIGFNAFRKHMKEMDNDNNGDHHGNHRLHDGEMPLYSFWVTIYVCFFFRN